MDHLLSSVTVIIKSGRIRVKKNLIGGTKTAHFFASGKRRTTQVAVIPVSRRESSPLTADSRWLAEWILVG